jgi:hypothetical protein
MENGTEEMCRVIVNAMYRYHHFEALTSIRILAAYHSRVITLQM